MFLEEETFLDVHGYTRFTECCRHLVNMSYVFVHIIRKDDDVVYVDQAGLPLILREHIVQRLLKEIRDIGDDE